MDIETRFRLRSVDKPAATPLIKAIVIAGVLHVGVGFYLNYKQPKSVTQLPDWVNIKLIAGVDESRSKNLIKINTAAKKQEKNPENKYQARKERQQHQKTIKNNRQTKNQEKKPVAASATTIIEANSRPYIHENPKPNYPAVARRRGMQGVVLLNVEVNANGRVSRIMILQSSGFRILDVAAIQSVEQWHFIPGSKGGINTASAVKIPIRFSLQQANSEY